MAKSDKIKTYLLSLYLTLLTINILCFIRKTICKDQKMWEKVSESLDLTIPSQKEMLDGVAERHRGVNLPSSLIALFQFSVENGRISEYLNLLTP